MEWLRSIRGRLTTLTKRMREAERCIRELRERIGLLEEILKVREYEVEDWT